MSYISNFRWTPVFAEEPPKEEDPTLPKDMTFTPEQQEAINKIMKAEKEKYRGKLTSALTEIDNLTRKTTLTAQEREELQKRVDDLNVSLKTKEELARENEAKLRKEAQSREQELVGDRDTWKSRFESSLIARSITDAAVKHGAYTPAHINALLGGTTRLVEVVDDAGKPTGTYTPRVTFPSIDDKGKSITLDLTVDEAVAKMKGMEDHAPLFKGEGTGGLGGRNFQRDKPVRASDLAKNDPKQFREELRKELGGKK